MLGTCGERNSTIWNSNEMKKEYNGFYTNELNRILHPGYKFILNGATVMLRSYKQKNY